MLEPRLHFVAALTLALSIGANTTLFSMLDAVLFRRTNDGPVRIFGRHVSTNYLNVLGVQPSLERGFLPQEGDPAAPVGSAQPQLLVIYEMASTLLVLRRPWRGPESAHYSAKSGCLRIFGVMKQIRMLDEALDSLDHRINTARIREEREFH